MMDLQQLLEAVARDHGIEPLDIQVPTKDQHVKARYEFCYRAAKETKASIREVAKISHYKDPAGVSYAIARHADSIGRLERTFSEARDGFKSDSIDWRRLCKLAQDVLDKHKVTQAEASRMSDRPRRVWANVLSAKSVSADDLVAVLVFLELSVSDVLTPKAKAQQTISTAENALLVS
jgi:hypothetical protein